MRLWPGSACLLFPLGLGLLGVSYSACIPRLDEQVIPYCGDGIIQPQDGEECDPGTLKQGVGTAECTGQCKVICKGHFVDGRCYFASEDTPGGGSRSFDEARADCAANGAHVLTLASNFEWERIQEASSASGWYWVSLKWSGDKGADAGGAAFFTSAGVGEPGAGVAESFYPSVLPVASKRDGGKVSLPLEGMCARIFASGDPKSAPKLERVPCVLTEGYDSYSTTRTLCEREPVGVRTVPCAPQTSCDGGTCDRETCFTVARTETAGKVYRLLHKPSTRDAESVALGRSAAYGACKRYGEQPVVPSDNEEREQIWTQLRRIEPNATRVWIGLYWDHAKDVQAWVWEDGARYGSTEGRHALMWPETIPQNQPQRTAAYMEYDVAEYDSQLARPDIAGADGGSSGRIRAYPLCMGTRQP